MNIDIAYRLSQIRRERGYSQETLANQLGVSRQAVSKWERAESSPDTDNLIALADLYGMSLDELLKGSGTDAEAGGESADAAACDDEATPGEKATPDKKAASGEGATPGEKASSNADPASSTADASNPADPGAAGSGESSAGANPGGESAADWGAPNRNGDYVDISWSRGIHVLDHDGSEVHLGPGGIHVYDPENGDRVDSDGHGGVVVNGVHYNSWRDVPHHGHHGHHGWECDQDGASHGRKTWMHCFPIAILAAIAFLAIGFLSPWGWGAAACCLLAIPLWYLVADLVAHRETPRRRKTIEGLWAVLVLNGFLVAGLAFGLWHPAWIALLLIPLGEAFLQMLWHRDR